MEKVQITIDQGILEGKTIKTDDGFEYDAFYGIPYAKPPLGALRFREPEPAEGWTGIRDATKLANSCAQFDILFSQQYVGEDDCLYLNVYMPHGTAAGADMPVMFWIHGGGFFSGSGNPAYYGPDFLLPNGVLLVTINYRLGPLGFMCLNIPNCAGNMGLKDQLLALKWVRSNITKFGGNPQNITIFGESAGGASAHTFVLTPLAKGLFDKAIMQSGTSINQWFTHDKSEDVAFKLGKLLGIETQDKYTLLNELREIPAEKLVMTSLSPELTDGTIIAFAPVVEKIFPETNAIIAKDPFQSMLDGDFNKVPTISGFTSNEGFIMVLMKIMQIGNVENLTLEVLVPDFKALIPSKLLGDINDEQKEEIAKKIKDYYFPNEENLLDKYADFQSDYGFVKDIDFSTKIFSKYSSPVYYYMFDYNGNLNMTKYLSSMPYNGASHVDELSYIFKMNINEIIPKPKKIMESAEKDILIIKRMTELWTNFAKYGNPTPKPSDTIDVVWKPVSSNETNCFEINEELSLIQNPFEERIQFWANLGKFA